MARRHIKQGYSYSDVLDWQRERTFSGLRNSPRTQPIHISLNSAAACRRHAAQMQDQAWSFYKRADHVTMARHARAAAKAWRLQLEPRAA